MHEFRVCEWSNANKKLIIATQNTNKTEMRDREDHVFDCLCYYLVITFHNTIQNFSFRF